MRNIHKAEEEARRLLDLVANLGRCYCLRDPLVQAAEDRALTPSQFHALMWLGKDGALTMGELSRRLGVTEKTMTGIVDRLEREGFARRERSATDRRVVEVSLTAVGMKHWKATDAQVLERTALFLGVLCPEDRDVLLSLVEKIVKSLTQIPREE